MKQLIVDALKKELAEYRRRGLDDRAKQVIDQLVVLGCEEFLPTLKKSSNVPTEDDSPQKPTAQIVSKPLKKRAVIQAATIKPDAKRKR